MVVSILALVALILATPSLLGRTTPELASLPLLTIGMSKNESFFLVNVGGAVQAYRYEMIRLSFNGTHPSLNRTMLVNDTYYHYALIPRNSSVIFTVDAYLVDQQGNYFEYNVTARTEQDATNRIVMVFTFPYETDNVGTVIRRTPPEDLRQPIPRRGTLP